MKKNTPLVSIGIPLYNDEDYIEETLDSLLSQTYNNFKLIICDDNSTDKSFEICKKYRKNDSRISLFKNSKNLGEINNFNKVANLAEGKYFMWAAGHDKWSKCYLEKCVNRLEKNPKASVCFSYRKCINNGNNIIKVDKSNLDTLNNFKLIGFIKSIWNLCDHVMYGVMRRDLFEKTRKYLHVLGPDHVLRSELSLQGEIIQIKEPLFYFRNQRNESLKEGIKRRVKRWKDRGKLGWVYSNIPHLGLINEISKAAWIHNNKLNKFIYLITSYFIGFVRYSKALLLDLNYDL